MKNTKFSKILVLVLTLALVIGAAFGIGTMAEGEEPAVEIVAQNVSYGGSISIMYAVKSTGLADGQYVVIEGSAFNPVDESIEAFTVSDFETTDYNVVVGEEDFGKLPVYYTPGIPLKNMATTVTAKAVVYNADNTKAAESASLSYSVLEYLYERQFMFDSVNSAEQKKLYSLMLETGDTVQKVLENYGAGFAPSDYAFASIEGGTVSGLTKGIVPKGTTVTLTGNAGGFIVTPLSVGDDYEIVEGTPVFVANNSNYTINGSVKAEPTRGFEAGSGKFFNNDAILGTKKDYSSGSAPGMDVADAGATAIIEDGVLKIATTTTTNERYANVIAHSATLINSIAFFEFEFKLSEMPEGTVWRFFEFCANKLGAEFYLQVQDGKFVPVTRAGNSTDGYTYTAIAGMPSFEANTWYNFSMEYELATAKANNILTKIMVNGIEYDDVKIVNTQTRSWTNNRVNVYLPNVNNISVELDNLVIGFLPNGDYARGQGANVNDVNFDCSTVMKTENSNGGIASAIINDDGTATVTSARDGSYLRWVTANSYTEGAKYVLEMDIKFNNWTQSGSGNAILYIDHGTARKGLTINSSDGFIRIGSSYIYLAKNTWYNVRIEYDFNSGSDVFALTVNGISLGNVNFTHPKTNSSSYERTLLYVASGDSISLDNVYCDYIAAE